jgi:hypothetical protein
MDTTRRYPRSMADAFPDVRAHCIEVYRSHGLKARLSRWIQRLFN